METSSTRGSFPRKRFFLVGLFTGIGATLILYIGSELIGLPFPPQAIFQVLILPVPGSVQSVVVETFREYAKYSVFTFAGALYAVIYAIMALGLGYIFRDDLAGQARPALLIAVGITSLIALGAEVVLAPTASILSTATGWLIAAALIITVNLAFNSILVHQLKVTRYATPTAMTPTTAPPQPARRGFLKKIVIIAAAVGAVAIASRIGLSLLSGQPVIQSNNPIPVNSQPVEVDQNLPTIFQDSRLKDLVDSEVTDSRIFYRVDIDPIPPQVNFDQWQLKVAGDVGNPLTLDKFGLMALPTKDQYATLECVSNTISPPGGLISNAKWTGVPLAQLLTQAKPSPNAKYAIFTCADGYTVGVPLELAMEPGALLAYKMNDDVLPNGHGFPLRAIVPGIYGMMNAKWLTQIDLSDQVYLGYWQQRGWSNDARIHTTSIIYTPGDGVEVNGRLPIAGIAFAGDRGISKVEVSTDGGQTWNQATLKPPRSPYSWVLWAYEWTPDAAGNHTIVVRATDGSDQLQDNATAEPFPNGASGYNTIQVTVT